MLTRRQAAKKRQREEDQRTTAKRFGSRPLLTATCTSRCGGEASWYVIHQHMSLHREREREAHPSCWRIRRWSIHHLRLSHLQISLMYLMPTRGIVRWEDDWFNEDLTGWGMFQMERPSSIACSIDALRLHPRRCFILEATSAMPEFLSGYVHRLRIFFKRWSVLLGRMLQFLCFLFCSRCFFLQREYISSWDLSNGTEDLHSMFSGWCTSFNVDLPSATDLRAMFFAHNCTSFNGDVVLECVSHVTKLNCIMFHTCSFPSRGWRFVSLGTYRMQPLCSICWLDVIPSSDPDQVASWNIATPLWDSPFLTTTKTRTLILITTS